MPPLDPVVSSGSKEPSGPFEQAPKLDGNLAFDEPWWTTAGHFQDGDPFPQSPHELDDVFYGWDADAFYVALTQME